MVRIVGLSREIIKVRLGETWVLDGIYDFVFRLWVLLFFGSKLILFLVCVFFFKGG